MTNVKQKIVKIQDVVPQTSATKKQLTSIEQKPVMSTIRDQILGWDVIYYLPMHVEEETTNLMLSILTAYDKLVGSHLLNALDSLVERTVEKLTDAAQMITCIMEAVISNLSLITATVAHFKSKRRG